MFMRSRFLHCSGSGLLHIDRTIRFLPDFELASTRPLTSSPLLWCMSNIQVSTTQQWTTRVPRINEWYSLGQAKKDTDQAIIRITEACIHTYTSTLFSEILKRCGIVENTSTARGLNRKKLGSGLRHCTPSPDQALLNVFCSSRFLIR